jgi:hypothetical protein
MSLLRRHDSPSRRSCDAAGRPLTEGSLARHARLLGGRRPATLEVVPGITSSRRSDLSGSPERDRGFAVLGRDELVQSIREREHRATEFARVAGVA